MGEVQRLEKYKHGRSTKIREVQIWDNYKYGRSTKMGEVMLRRVANSHPLSRTSQIQMNYLGIAKVI